MGRRDKELTPAELLNVQQLGALADSGAGEALVKASGIVTNASVATLADTIVVGETPTGDINGSNKTFTLANTPTAGTVALYLNGQRLDAGGEDYTISGATITMMEAPITGDIFLADYEY